MREKLINEAKEWVKLGMWLWLHMFIGFRLHAFVAPYITRFMTGDIDTSQWLGAERAVFGLIPVLITQVPNVLFAVWTGHKLFKLNPRAGHYARKIDERARRATEDTER